MINSFVLIISESTEEKEERVWKIPLMFGGLRGDKEGDEMAFVYFMECVQSLNSVHNALGCVCFWWPAAEGRENETDTDRLEGGDSRTASEKQFVVFS